MEENLKQQHTDIIKIALFGPESTGKTTLAQELASHFNTVWSVEFARDYLQEKFDASGHICTPDDLLPIAIGQTALENDALAAANKYLFCDTCLLLTKVYSEIYYNYCGPILDKAARKHKYDLFFLTDIDVPWEKDDLRDRPNDREAIFEAFKNALIENNKPFIILSGDSAHRLEKAIKIVEDLTRCIEMGFTPYDFIQIHNHGISPETIKKHLQIFSVGTAKTILDRPAKKQDGILMLSDDDFKNFATYFDIEKPKLKLQKFVPASGAASRMFKFLSEFNNEFDPENETINAYINRKNATNLTIFLAGLEKFPFFQNVKTKLRSLYADFDSWESQKKRYHFIKILLSEDHFDVCNKPKGILPFHKYASHVATPIEEHMNECAFYATSNAMSRLHFTISETHRQQFEKIISGIKGKVEKKSGSRVDVDFSYQDRATDTIAVGLDNKPLRAEGKLVFRPGGHGALIDNLNSLEADIIFIKNIDNVIQNHILTIALYKKALAGVMIKLQLKIFRHLRQIEKKQLAEAEIDAIIEFAEQKLHIATIEDFPKYTTEYKLNYIRQILNRPIRVCGMVKNEGEPGGGPFWVRDQRGNRSLQIVEMSQIDTQNSEQSDILKQATHFNPVDLVCGIKDYKGNKFNLAEFVDHNSGFIVQKNKNGKDLKAYELPGLWNGAMAKWITIFVEVPLVTFNPVKTVNDLLKSAHQPD